MNKLKIAKMDGTHQSERFIHAERMEWVSLKSRIKNGVDSLCLLYLMDTD